MKWNPKYRPFLYVLILAYIIGFCYFYYKYVPLIKSFQVAFIPVLLSVFILTLLNDRWGVLAFLFCFPLINNLPYFFGIYENTPHAPAALVLFLVFFMAWLIKRAYSSSPLNLTYPVFKPLILFSLIIFVSGLVTFFRYANFFPILSDRIHELVVNINDVRAGGALMSDVFGCLNYLSGFLLFFVILNSFKDKDFVKKLLFILSFSIFLSLLFSFVQMIHSIDIGNTPMWIYQNSINSTYQDPNSFGLILASSLPLFMGLFLNSPKIRRFFFLFLFFLGLFIFPSIGSRSGFLAIGISFICFFLMFMMNIRASFRRKIFYSVSFFSIVLLLVFSFLVFFRDSRLYRRIDTGIDTFADDTRLNEFTIKLEFWKVASTMIRKYPLTGVGTGAFIVELPNYMMTEGLPYSFTDSTENYFIQVGSELGLIGLFLIFWVFFEVLRQILKNRSAFSLDDRDKYVYIGAVCGLISIFINFIFHSYIGSFDVKYFFWFLVFLVFAYSRKGTETEGSFERKHGSFVWLAVILPVIFGVLHLWNSTHSLSIQSRTKMFGWEQNFGLYELEKDNRGISFQWTRRHAGIEIKKLGIEMVVPIFASHPDIQRNPVKVGVFLADEYFRKMKLLGDIGLNSAEWKNVEFSMSDQEKDRICLVFETNRTWQPLKNSGVPDPRSLGIGLANIWFKYPKDVPAEKVREVQKVSSDKWEGAQKSSLYSDGMSQIRFRIHQGNFALRLALRGQKAFDVGPFIMVKLNGREIGKTVIAEEEWTTLVFSPLGESEECILSVEFTNDVYDADRGQDRNLFLGDLEIMYLK